MRGHEKIIAARLAGEKPKFIFVNDWPCKIDQFETNGHATVSTAGDPISSVDFRFLVGTEVSISACTEARAKALFEKAKAAGARLVAACHVQDGVPGWKQSGWVGVHRNG